MAMTKFSVSATPFDRERLHEALAHPGAGACAIFEGWVRDQHQGCAVEGLRYEAYKDLAETEGGRIIHEAVARFGCIDAICVHRTGDLAIGDLAVWVGVSAAHRGPAFDACRYIIDEVKARVPIWKHERYRGGEGDWLHPESGSA
jgi:molybdopterin synthase catalytic subunit